MKIRKGFVSNSSSSSFVCDLTGEDVSGWDISLSDTEMVACQQGHTFMYCGYPEVQKWAVSAEDCEDYAEEDRNSEYGWGLPEHLCPICQKEPKAMKAVIERIKGEMTRLGITAKDVK